MMHAQINNADASAAEALAGGAAFLAFLTQASGGKLSVSQAAFFLAVAAAEADCREISRAAILSLHHDKLSHAVRRTYRQLLEPSEQYPNALGWVRPEPSPNDAREHLLKLTTKGRAVAIASLQTLRPLRFNEPDEKETTT